MTLPPPLPDDTTIAVRGRRRQYPMTSLQRLMMTGISGGAPHMVESRKTSDIECHPER